MLTTVLIGIILAVLWLGTWFLNRVPVTRASKNGVPCEPKVLPANLNIEERAVPMADSPRTLSIGFFGAQEVHRNNSRALIDDLVAAWKRDNKNGKVSFVFPVDTFTGTMEDLADHAVTSGHRLGFVGHKADFENPKLQPFLPEANGTVYNVKDGGSITNGIVGALAVASEARLILVSDPNEDDDAYAAFEVASGMGITVRSLLQGLDEIVMESDDEQENNTVAVAPEEFDDETLEDLDEDDVVEGDEFDQIDQAIDADVDEDEADEPVADVISIDSDVEDEVDDDEPVAVEASDDAPWTEERLQAMADTDRTAFYALAASHDILPGRGIKTTTMITRILEANGVTVEKKAPVKRVPKVSADGTPAKRLGRPRKDAAPVEVTKLVDMAQELADAVNQYARNL